MKKDDPDDSRLVDYLEDRVQTVAELDAVDDLLDSIKCQSDLLTQQLVEARQQWEHCQKDADSHASTVRNQAADFQLQQRDIDRALMMITRSETSDDALANFDSILRTMQRLDNATGVVDMYHQVEEISKHCKGAIESDLSTSLDCFDRLQDFARDILHLQEAAEGAAPHLIDHVLHTRDVSREAIYGHLSHEMQEHLKSLSWPKANACVPSATRKRWSELCRQMLRLQRFDLLHRHKTNRTKKSMQEPMVLLPFEFMVEPLAQRFQYHFSGDRTTNRIDKPDFFLRHVLDLIGDYSEFVELELQPVLLHEFHNTDLARTPAYIDATSAWITALLPTLQNKLIDILPELSKQPGLLSNLVQEVIWFDEQLTQDWAYTPLSPAKPYRGLAHYLLTELGALKPWLAAERSFAVERYHVIVANGESDATDYESVSAAISKPTTAAVQLKDLLETITQRYKSLSSFSHKIVFLVDIQLTILDQFQNYLYEKLRVYLSDSTMIGGILSKNITTGNEETKGLRAPEYLIRILGPCEYLEQTMRDWSDDVFFLELWEELQYRTQNAGSITGDFSMADVAAKTSAALTSKPGEAEQLEELQGALFDEPISSYRGLRARTEKALIELLIVDFRSALQGYTKISDWASLRPVSSASSSNAELEGLTRLLERYLGFLAKALGRSTLRRIMRPVGHSIGDFFLGMLMQRSMAFSSAGAAQLATDVHSMWAMIDCYVGPGQGKASMRRLVDALLLLTLPCEGQADGDIDGDNQLRLRAAEQRIAQDGETAAVVLESLGIEYLNAQESRQVLRRRVELSTN